MDDREQLFDDYCAGTIKGFERRYDSQGYQYLYARRFSETGLVDHGFTLRHSGLGRLHPDAATALPGGNPYMDFRRDNLKGFFSGMGIAMDHVILANAAHGAKVFTAGRGAGGRGFVKHYKAYEPTYDGLVTSERDLCLNTTHADCTGVLFLDPSKRIIAACHAGWRGTVDGVIRNTVTAMESEFGCCRGDILAAVTPGIKSCCFQVRGDVIDRINRAYDTGRKFYVRDDDEFYHVDLERITLYELYLSGIRSGNITVAEECTCCNESDFYSYRRDGRTVGVMNSFIRLK